MWWIPVTTTLLSMASSGGQPPIDLESESIARCNTARRAYRLPDWVEPDIEEMYESLGIEPLPTKDLQVSIFIRKDTPPSELYGIGMWIEIKRKIYDDIVEWQYYRYSSSSTVESNIIPDKVKGYIEIAKLIRLPYILEGDWLPEWGEKP